MDEKLTDETTADDDANDENIVTISSQTYTVMSTYYAHETSQLSLGSVKNLAGSMIYYNDLLYFFLSFEIAKKSVCVSVIK